MTSPRDDRADQQKKATAARAPRSAEVKAAQARSTTAAKKPASTTTSAKAAAPKKSSSNASTVKSSTPKSTPKSTAAKSSPATSTAAKTVAAQSAAKKTAAKKAASKTASAKSAAAKTTAAKTAAAKRAADAKAAEQAADEAKATKTAEKTDAVANDAVVEAPEQDAALEVATEKTPAKRKPRVKSAVAADAAAPVADAVRAPAEPESAAELAESEPAAEPATEPAAEPAAESASEPAEPAPEQAADTATAADTASDAVEALTAVVADAVGAASATDAVKIRGLIKDFGDHRAVNNINLTIPTGCFYGIVGPNGAGKTTTLSILAGLLRADEGEVVVCGIDQAADSQGAKRVMGVLPDRLRTFDRLTGRQLLHYYGLLRGLSADVIEKRAADLVRAFDLVDAVGRVVSDYSAGMTKKIMLAGAMIHSPRVLVLDEPFEAVDPVSSAVILDILRAYVSHGGTVILSSHGMDLVQQVCSRVAIIVGGEVLAEGTVDEVRAGQTLESRFVELSGGIGEVEGLEWLHTFSD
ncbi:ATP-binding cassette domain-containing protein [Microbacterium sp. A588]